MGGSETKKISEIPIFSNKVVVGDWVQVAMYPYFLNNRRLESPSNLVGKISSFSISALDGFADKHRLNSKLYSITLAPYMILRFDYGNNETNNDDGKKLVRSSGKSTVISVFDDDIRKLSDNEIIYYSIIM